MKIQCDVCNEKEAVVYCSADEAALCFACDHSVHHANKLAGKHPRFNLLHPPPKDFPVCDICQEKKAFLFCQQDRAILCKDCDVGIHKVNQLTRNHSRFLLTGVKLSPTASLYSSSTTKNGVVGGQQGKPLASMIMKKAGVQTPSPHHESNGLGPGSSTSSISEYLIETLPGWHVEDFLDPPPTFSKAGDNDPWPVWGEDLLDGSFNSSLEPESMGIWVPQAPPAEPQPQYANVLPQFEPGSYTGFGDQIINGSSLSFAPNKIAKGPKSSRKWTSDNGNCFTVPQISPSSTTSKRSRTLWH
ncbi:putative transcription factor interactor and regulator Znf-B family [Helianthus annuus]|uniref:Putative B-box-type zinc finger n=1 Tax=Helianthus annuus TaxID=4232 RepID=A0A251V5M8_HELAN|nr:B-box zinc finger protein 21 [Helianthus annuus]KAF5796933.1 putative transcription factor interactor and regulator Znf-B family [Helianthus annuus]KAJ0540179.1 putative transcription factor interactor and regulator Znf-B family [Helianthus annuus]KAJ0548642.1 putative transcription factor interactor and regulator Znf-B family [Helianthus annuus]KAJ0554923.1 putative transcription factor interactor and regulator Znf-B family [Helianthus annuus]KAJ0720490.1 putative transcription factor inte